MKTIQEELARAPADSFDRKASPVDRAREADTEKLNEVPMADRLQWQSLHGWEPAEGTWAILWPGHYGPFTACWINGRWTMCEDIDFNNATIGAEIDLPHLVTDAVPRVDQGGYSIPRKVGEE